MPRKNVLTHSRKKKAFALFQAKRLEEAKALYVQVCEVDKLDADAWLMRGAVNGMLNLHQEAAECFQKAVLLNPSNSEAHYNLGIALRSLDKPADAETAFRQALKSRPEYADALECLAHILLNRGELNEAGEILQRAIRLRPDNPEWHSNLGTIYQAQGFLEKSISCYRRAQQLKPGGNIACENLGSALTSQGKIDEALAVYREGVANNPKDARLRSNLLMALNYIPGLDPQSVLDEHRAWAKAAGEGNHGCESLTNARNPERQLRVGYISPDFREHSVANFFEPLMTFRNRDDYKVVCYSDVPRPDATTERLRALADDWHDTHKLNHDQLAQLIRADGIDILIDLAGHTANNRLPVFVKKPAPIQVTYLGYPNTTGLSAIDYRLTDALADPAGQEKFHTEELWRLPGCFLCYQPLADAPSVGPLPAAKNGYVTFGSFNNLAKMNIETVRLWSKILHEAPQSRLLVKNHSLTDPATRERYQAMFHEQGIPAERVELVGHVASRKAHLGLYGRIDIALDTFPYNGTTTTCEALWMGVPVITLAGKTHAGRVGLSLLTALKLGELIADTPQEYVARAETLANDREKLAHLRATLRERMLVSSLCDAQAFARKVEAAYREMWREWCAKTVRASPP